MPLSSIQVEPARGGWRKFPAARHVHYKSEKQVLPIGAGRKPQHIFSTLFCEFVLFLFQSLSTAATTSRLFAALLTGLGSSQFFSQLSSTVLNDFAPLFRSFHLFSPLFNFSHDFSLLVNSSQRLSSISLHLFSILLNSSQLFSPQLNSSKFFSARLNSFQAQTCSTLLPFARCLWLVQLVFVLFPGNSFVIINSFYLGSTIRNSFTSSSIVLTF